VVCLKGEVYSALDDDAPQELSVSGSTEGDKKVLSFCPITVGSLSMLTSRLAC